MSVYVTNRSGFVADQLAIRVQNEHVGGLLVPSLDANVTIPPRTLHEWHVVDLCTSGPNPTRPWEALSPFLSVRKINDAPRTDVYSRPISAWCTHFADTALATAIQTDRVVQLHADYPYDADWDGSTTTNGVFALRAARGSWPPGYADAVYLRLECERAQGHGQNGFGIAQINVFSGPEIVEGTDNDGSGAFREQWKGLTREGQREAYGVVRLPIHREAPGVLALFVSPWSKGHYSTSGFELRAAMPESIPEGASVFVPPPPDTAQDALRAALPTLRALVTIAENL